MPSGVKTITGTTITTGYVLKAGYTGLSITSTGAVKGVAGGAGANNSGSVGGAGTVGLSVAQAIVANIDGAVTGGAGGAGGSQNNGVAGAGGAGATGASFAGGGTLTNTGKILGGAGGAGGATNKATITNANGGVGGLGLSLTSASMSLVNTGTIEGGAGGAAGSGGTGGATGALGAGVSILAGGAIVNGTSLAHTALIEGSSAVYAGSAAAVTITNFASIVGTTGNSVTFKNAGDRLIAETSAVFTGAIAGGGGALEIGTGTDTIAALGGAGTLTGSTTGTFSGFGSYQVDTGASATLTGTDTLASSQTITNNGALTLAGSFNNSGSIVGASTVTSLGVAATGTLINKGTITGGAIGVSVAAGGYVSNLIASARAFIQGAIGVYAGSVGAVTVSNLGKITGTTDAVLFKSSSDRLIALANAEFYGTVVGGGGTLEMKNGGTTSVTDQVTGLGGTAAFLAGFTAGTVTGFGTYVVDSGVVLTTASTALTAGESLINNGKVDVSGAFASAGQISSGAGIDALTTTNGTITNTGSVIAGAGGAGINIDGAATITNGSSAVSTALVQGSVGIYDNPTPPTHSTVINWGTIQGTTGDAINFGHSSDLLKVESGAVFIGLVAGGGGSLEFAGGTVTISGLGSTGTLSGNAAGTFSNFGKYTIDSGVSVVLNGTNSLASGKTVSTFGTITLNGSLANAGTINGNNQFLNDITVASGGTLTNSGLINGAYDGAVVLAAGGSVTNSALGSITGDVGVYVLGAATLTNAGVINGLHNGVSLAAGASVVNTGTLQGSGSFSAVYASGAATVSNSGYIEGFGIYAVKFKSTGDRLAITTGAKFKGKVAGGGGALEFVGGNDSLTGLGGTATLSGDVTTGLSGSIVGFGAYQVDSGATLALTGSNKLNSGQSLINQGSLVVTGSLTNSAGVSGVVGLGAGGTVANFGTILSTGDGVTFTGAGTVVNSGTGLIEGATGVYASVAGTVNNAATIQGTGAYSVQFKNSSDRLIVQASAAFVGAVAGGGGALEIASGADTITGLGGAGTLSGSASATFSGFGAYTITSPATLNLAGGDTLAAGQTLANPFGRLFLDGTLANAGTITSASSGGIWIDAGGALQNSGLIAGASYGVNLDSTTALTNAVGGYISAGVVGVVANAGVVSTIVNYGTIKGGVFGNSVNLQASGDRLVVESGSTLIGLGLAGTSGDTLEVGGGSDTLSGLGGTATISGSVTGTFSGFNAYVIDSGATLTLSGFGNTLLSGRTLSATNAVDLLGSSSLTNRGQFSAGLAAAAGATVNNYSTIIGAVSFAGAGDLILNKGGTIGGAVSGGGGVLQIASGYDTITGLGGTATLSGMGSATFSGFGTYLIAGTVSPGPILTLAGGNTLAAGQSISNPGGRLFLSGTLANAGAISDAGAGGIWLNAFGVLENSGSIIGGAYGVQDDSYAAMINAAGGYIGAGSNGVVLGVANATVVNYGSIAGGAKSLFLTQTGDKLVVESGSTLTGLAQAVSGDTLELAGGTVSATGLGGSATTLSGAAAGTLTGFSAYVVDAGAHLTLTGTNLLTLGHSLSGAGVTLTGTLTNGFYMSALSGYDAVYVKSGGVLVNNGTIVGGPGAAGVYAAAGATVTNYGTISGSGGYSVEFGGASTLIAESGAKFVGAVVGGGGRLEIAGGADYISGLGGSGTLSGAIHGYFSGFGSYKLDNAATITITGANSLAAGAYMNDVGLLALAGKLTNAGTMQGGPLAVQNLATFTNTGTFATNAGIALSPGGTIDNSGTITNTGAGGTVEAITTGAAVLINSGTISAGTGDAVDLNDAADRLVVESGAAFIGGEVVAKGGALEVGSGSISLSGLGGAMTLTGQAKGTLTGFGGYKLDAGATLTLTGSNTLSSGVTIANYGVLDLTGSLVSYGYIFGDDAMDVGAGGSFANHGSLASATGAVIGVSGGGYVANLGTFSGTAGADGVSFSGAGTLVNGSTANATALVLGADGVYAGPGGAATVTNFATIRGGVDSVLFGNAADRLIVESGAYFDGAVLGGGGTLELAGGSDTITGMGGASETLSGSADGMITDFGVYQVDAGVTLALAGYNVLNGSLIGAGEVNLAGTLVNTTSGDIGGRAYGVNVGVSSTLFNYGTIKGTTDSVKLTDTTAQLNVGTGATFVGPVVGGGGTLAFSGGTHTLTGLGASATLSGGSSGTLSGFGGYAVEPGATLNLAGYNSLAAGAAVTNNGSLNLIGTLAIYGTVQGGHGIDLKAGGSLFNDGQIAITGAAGVFGGGAFVNTGTVGVLGADGVSFSGAGYVFNKGDKAVTGVISGAVGVYAGASGAVTVNNQGTLQGTVGDSVQFKNSADRLIVTAGAAFIGSVAGGGGTLELITGDDTISGLGASASLSGGATATLGGFGAYVIDSGVSLTLAGGDALASGHSITNDGGLTLTGTLVNSGQIYSGYGVTGITVAAGGSLSNTGVNSRILGGAGVNGDPNHDFSQPGGAGAAAVHVTSGAVYNGGTFQGGDGGYGGLSTSAYPSGGAGGAGVDASVSITLVNKGGIWGGNGGTGGTGVNAGGSGGAGGAGVELQAGGRVVNYHTIKGGAAGAPGQGSANPGSAAFGAGGAGLVLNAGGTLINETGGVVSGGYGGYGVYAGAGGVASIINFGAINGSFAPGIGYGGYSVVLENAADLLVAEAGSSFGGWVYGGGGTFELAGTGSPTGTIHGLGSNYATLTGAVSGHIGDFGTYVFNAGGSWTLTGVNRLASRGLDAAGTLSVANGASLIVSGQVQDSGTIALSGTSLTTDLVFASSVTLAGGGVLLLDGPDARIRGAAPGLMLTNIDTIKGQGSIALASDSLVNLAVIDALGGNLALSSHGTVTNSGLMTAESGAHLTMSSCTVQNALGTILALSGGHVRLSDDDIVGGRLGSAGAGAVNVYLTGNEFDGSVSTVTLVGKVEVVAAASLVLDGAIANSGLLGLYAGGATADLIVGSAGATLSGGGQVYLSNAAGNRISGQAAGDTLTNIDNRITGSGLLGDGAMILVNEVGGKIVGSQNLALTIDTGTATIINAGLIENDGAGGTVVKSSVNNTGTLLAAGGTLQLTQAVTGAGVGQVNRGVLYAKGSFTENVLFNGSTGVLELGDSVDYTGQITGLSRKGTNWLDLDDIAFTKGATTASFSGGSTSGVLTVTDGIHTAHIVLVGDYLGSIFTVSAGANGGTKVVDPAIPTAAAAPLVQAMSSMAATTAAASARISAPPLLPTPLLASPI